MSTSSAFFCAIDRRGRHLEDASLQIGTIKGAREPSVIFQWLTTAILDDSRQHHHSRTSGCGCGFVTNIGCGSSDRNHRNQMDFYL